MHPLLLSESPADETSSNSDNLSESPADETSSNSDNYIIKQESSPKILPSHLSESSADETSSNSDNYIIKQESSPKMLPSHLSESSADETSSNSDNYIIKQESSPKMLPLHLSESSADETSSNSDNLSKSADDETSSNSDNLSESSAESACSQETSPTAAPTAEKKLENGKTEVNHLEQEVIHRVSSADEVTVRDIARESVDIICEKMHRLPEEFLNELKNGLRVILEGGNGSQHKEEIFIMQKLVQSRTDLTAATLIRAHRVQLEILVAIKTRIPVFLHPSITLSQISLVEIFGYKRCRNIGCQKGLPADDCTCEICTRSNGFCNLCMCVICNKFDFEVNTFHWIGCDFCSHWTHTNCAIHKQLISTGPSVKSGAGPSEMVFRCQACNMTSELLCWVKDVFQNCAPSWNGESFLRELDYVSKIFHACKDPRGRELFWKCDDLKEKLRSGKIESMGACRAIMMFLQGNMSVGNKFAQARLNAERAAARLVGNNGALPTPRSEPTLQPQPVNTVSVDAAYSALVQRERKRKNVSDPRPQDNPSNTQSQEKKDLVDLSGSSNPNQKKHKSEKRHKSAPFAMDDFLKVTYDEFRSNPFGASLSVFKHMTDLVEKMKEEADGQVKETKQEAEEAWKALELTSTALNKARQELSELKKEKAKSDKDKGDVVQKAQDLEVKLKEAETRANEVAKLNLTLQARETELEAKQAAEPDSSYQDRITELEAELQKAREQKGLDDKEIASVWAQLVEMMQSSFENALQQAAVLHPGFVLDPNMLHPDHEVQDGRIVKVDITTKVVSTIFPPSYCESV